MSGEAEQEYFSDGISEGIITDLSEVSALVRRLAQHGLHLPDCEGLRCQDMVARQLHNVSHVSRGSVRKAGNRVRVAAQPFEEARMISHIWAERSDRDLNDIFAVQDEISHDDPSRR